jgi:hypothetical protein
MDPQVEIPKSSIDSFELPCGHVDQESHVHTDVTVREMTGEDEEVLAARNMPTTKKINKILIRCTDSIGPFTGDALKFIIPELTQGDRVYLLMAIRRASLGDEMPFQTKCPSCKEEARFIVDLNDLETKKMANPALRQYDVVLPKSKSKVRMKVLTGKGEEAISKAATKGQDVISTAILARIESMNDKPITIQDLKALPLADRNFLRGAWEEHEGGVDTEIQVDCPSCGTAYETELDISQQGFFNPSATLSNWKKKYSF